MVTVISKEAYDGLFDYTLSNNNHMILHSDMYNIGDEVITVIDFNVIKSNINKNLYMFKLSNGYEIIAQHNKYYVGDVIPSLKKEITLNDIYTKEINSNNPMYLRDISYSTDNHCKKTKIESIRSIKKADKLELITFEDNSWQVISQKDLYHIGDEIVYIPPGTILPVEMSEEIGVTQYLEKGVVKAINIRGEKSEGLIVSIDVFEKYKEFIFEYNTQKELRADLGTCISDKLIPYGFDNFRKADNLKNCKKYFNDNENIWTSEKIEGMNGRFGRFKSKVTGLYELFVGSHYKLKNRYVNSNVYIKLINTFPSIMEYTPRWFRIILKNICDYISKKFPSKIESNCEFWKFVKTIPNIDELPVELEFFFELYGPGIIPGFHYGLTKPTGKCFAIKLIDRYLSVPEVVRICEKYNIPCVNFTKMKFNLEQLETLANSPSELTNKHIREGIVIISDEDPSKTAKLKSIKYLEFKDPKKGK